MAEYHLLSVWRIEAPLAEVFAAIKDTLRWPDWWPSVREVDQTLAGDAKGIGSVRRYAWQGRLPYRVVFDVRATRIDELAALEGVASGDLAGTGHWKFSSEGNLSVVHYEWHVHSKRWWMNLVAPVARAIFVRNHAQIMAQGGKALARLLKAPLVGQENTDLMADAARSGARRAPTPKTSGAKRHEGIAPPRRAPSR